MRVALVLFSGPEMPCKLQHAFIFARDIVARGGAAKIVFEGNSPKWLLELPDPKHSMFRLYQMVKGEGLLAGVCQACASVNGALEAARTEGLSLLNDAFGHASLAPFIRDGYEVITL